MPGRAKDPRRFRLASGRQLWRLNELGRLRVVDEASPVSSSQAKLLIAAEFERLDRESSAPSAEPEAARS